MRIFILLLFSVQCFGQNYIVSGSSEEARTVVKNGKVVTDLSKLKLTWPSSENLTEPVGDVALDISNDAIYTPVPIPVQSWQDTTKKKPVDTLSVPLVSIKESMDFLKSINEKLLAMKTLNLIQDREYNELVKELNRIVAILDKKKKAFK